MWRTSKGPPKRKSYHVVFGKQKEFSLARDAGAEGVWTGVSGADWSCSSSSKTNKFQVTGKWLMCFHSEECCSLKITRDVSGWQGEGDDDTVLIKSSLRNGATFSLAKARESKARPYIFFSLNHRGPEGPPMEPVLTWQLMPGLYFIWSFMFFVF